MLARFGMSFEGRQKLYAAVLAAGVQVISGDDAGISKGSVTASSPKPSSTSWPVVRPSPTP